jgi:hypothetical protein
MMTPVGLADGMTGRSKSPPPAVGATLIAASVVVLLIGLGWLSRGSDADDDGTALPMVDGVTLPTDSDGQAVDVPPSQPATAVSFGTNGEILRPDPVRARVVDRTGNEILITLPPNTTVDTTTGEIVPVVPGTTTSPSGTASTTSGTTTTTRGSTTTPTTSAPTTAPPTTDPPTTDPPTTDPPTTDPPTTDPPTTDPPTTDPPTTDPPTTEPEPTILDDLTDLILP